MKHLCFQKFSPNIWLQATVKKTVSSSQISDIDFRVRKLNKYESAITNPKRIKLSVKSQLTSSTGPSKDIQEEFLRNPASQSTREVFLSVHEKYNKPKFYLPLSQQTKLPTPVSSFYMEDKQTCGFSPVNDGLLQAN